MLESGYARFTKGLPTRKGYVLTNHKDVALVRDLTGYKVFLQPFEEVTKVIIERDDDVVTKITLAVARVRGRESRGRFIITERGTELRTWTRKEPLPGKWFWERDSMTFWSPVDDEQIILRGHVMTPQEAAAKRQWELDCHRPGNARNPMDNFDRITQGI